MWVGCEKREWQNSKKRKSVTEDGENTMIEEKEKEKETVGNMTKRKVLRKEKKGGEDRIVKNSVMLMEPGG